MGTMTFIPPWERPPEPDAADDLVDWCLWRLDCGGQNANKDVAQKLALRIHQLEARMAAAEGTT